MWRMHRGRLAAILLLLVAACSACGSAATPSPTPSTTPSTTPTPTPSCADRVFATMTLDQRIGQLFELGLAGERLGPTEINMIQADHIGSVWVFVGNSGGGEGNHVR